MFSHEEWRRKYVFWNEMPQVSYRGSCRIFSSFIVNKSDGRRIKIWIYKHNGYTQYHLSNRVRPSRFINFDDVFDLLSDEQKDYVLFNLDLI